MNTEMEKAMAIGDILVCSPTGQIKNCMTEDNKKATHICSTFPGKYSPIPSLSVADRVCIATQNPPEDNMILNNTKRNPVPGIFNKLTAPLESSMIPDVSTCKCCGNSHKIHLERKQRTILKVTIHPHTFAVI